MSNSVDQQRIIERECGGWLGFSVSADGLNIGVVGQSQEQTKVLLTHAIERWRSLLGSQGNQGEGATDVGRKE